MRMLSILALAVAFVFGGFVTDAKADKHIKIEIKIVITVPDKKNTAQIENAIARQLQRATNRSLPELARMAEGMAREALAREGTVVGRGQTETRVSLAGSAARLVSREERARLQTVALDTGIEGIKRRLDGDRSAQRDGAVTVLFSIGIKF